MAENSSRQLYEQCLMVVFRILPSWIMLLSIKPSGIPKQFTVEQRDVQFSQIDNHY